MVTECENKGVSLPAQYKEGGQKQRLESAEKGQKAEDESCLFTGCCWEEEGYLLPQRHLNTRDVFAVPDGMRWEQNQERSAVHPHAPLRPGLHFTQDSGVEECSLYHLQNPISSPFSSTSAVKAKALSDPGLFPQLPCCFKDADVWPLMQPLAGATGTFLGLGRGIPHDLTMSTTVAWRWGWQRKEGVNDTRGSCLEDVQTAAGEWS